jgi:phosphatidylinositol 4-kinase
LTAIVSKGDTQTLEQHRSHIEVSATAKEIAAYLPVLSALLPKSPEPPYETNDWEMISLFRNAWFNMVVHEFSKNSEWTEQRRLDLEVLARSTPPLVSETSANKVESELDLNTVIRRGSSHFNVNNQKRMMQHIYSHRFEATSISYSKLMFLSAAVLLESLRANAGNCSKVLLYFGDPDFRSGETGKYMANIATDTVKSYITNVIRGGKEEFTADNVAEQFKEVLILCCHRVTAVQNIAFTCAELIIKAIPSALCKRSSLFALLDLMTLLWSSCLDAETDEYEPRTAFTTPASSNITIELSDSYDHRQQSVRRLITSAREWVGLVLATMSFDLKNLLTTYLTEMGEYRPFNHVAMGCTFALEIGGSISRGDGEIATIAKTEALFTDTASGFLSQYIWRTEFKPRHKSDTSYHESSAAVQAAMEDVIHNHGHHSLAEMRDLLFRAATILRVGATPSPYLAQLAVKLPFKFFTERHLEMGISLWLWIMNEVPLLRMCILTEVTKEWEQTVKERKGLFSRKLDMPPPEYMRMEYAPSNKMEVLRDTEVATRAFSVHVILMRFLSSVFQASTYESRHLLRIFLRMITVGLKGLSHASLHPLARSVRFELIKFALDVLDVHSRFSARIADQFKELTVTSALTWFAQRAHWPFGGNKLKLRADVVLLKDIALRLYNMRTKPMLSPKRDLLLLFMNDELTKMSAWLDPLQSETSYRDGFGKKIVKQSSISAERIHDFWAISPQLVVYLAVRVNETHVVHTLERLISAEPMRVMAVPEALRYFMSKSRASTQVLLYWVPVNPIESIKLFLPTAAIDSFVLQYAMRSLESHDVNLTFFYVPQIVQSLRYDTAGYIETYILETAKISQLFAHQIIWNILANAYKDEDSTEPDPMKPQLDAVIAKMTGAFNAEEKNFYQREFSFFNEVTSISGKLKPFIKRTKAEKKAKIDEEIAQIKVSVGVYLPSNPDGTVVAIDRKSGKPLQSHAKAPFLAKFKIRREVAENADESSTDVSVVDAAPKFEEVWQGAIFKVGDDCRQDMLALQIISVFRTIFKSAGLDLYVYPYRVTATAPGCGVIDVLPDAISRDMLGREAVNGLYEYFTSKHGGEDSIDFQRARNNFVKSLAAYSVISYLIQFKDRHNGNIMYDNEGHILHIDFGFCFDIVPGGVKFEAAPFKLTSEMVAVLGGTTRTQAYRWFEELCVKAYLASRPHAESIIQIVMPMLDSGLPCFKGEATIRRLRARFVLDKTEREAALYFKSLIKRSVESFYTKGYDEFQRITNGIPY